MKAVLSTAYWPNLLYFSTLINSEEILIEQYEHYGKQSFRNRTGILTSNGVLALSIPVVHEAPKQQTKDIRINYREKWQIRHWRAITSAYNNSPYFEYFEDEVKQFYTEQKEYLLDYNLQQLKLIKKLLKANYEWKLTDDYQVEYSSYTDLRELIHPKKKTELETNLLKPYYQTFGEKFGFVPNLSILDLIFNTGLGAVNYLRDETV